MRGRLPPGGPRRLPGLSPLPRPSADAGFAEIRPQRIPGGDREVVRGPWALRAPVPRGVLQPWDASPEGLGAREGPRESARPRHPGASERPASARVPGAERRPGWPPAMGARPRGWGSPPARCPPPRESPPSWTGSGSSGAGRGRSPCVVLSVNPGCWRRSGKQEVFRGGVYDASFCSVCLVRGERGWRQSLDFGAGSGVLFAPGSSPALLRPDCLWPESMQQPLQGS